VCVLVIGFVCCGVFDNNFVKKSVFTSTFLHKQKRNTHSGMHIQSLNLSTANDHEICMNHVAAKSSPSCDVESLQNQNKDNILTAQCLLFCFPMTSSDPIKINLLLKVCGSCIASAPPSHDVHFLINVSPVGHNIVLVLQRYSALSLRFAKP